MQSALFTPLRLSASGSKIPAYLYGCAWKKDETADLVYKALSSGFKGIDVAAQPKHYREDLAGEGVRRAIAEGVVKREDLFVCSVP
jgi:diketogulonate reductase-like aldo/keto reductase